jgi:two-component system cell cycle sensor histidine kinase/response regulator CckA
MLGRVIGEHVVLETHVEERLQLVRFDPAQIEQIIINLVVNARDAMMPDGGQITVAIRNRKLREPLYREEGTIPLGDYVTLSVADTGSGISPENVSHIFEPFFTTKEVGQGTGLGLSTLYGILKQSNGHVTVETELGVGTIFEIYLPVALDREKSERVIRSQPSVPTNSGCVLLVEDEALVRNYAKRALEGLGYRVLEASGPTQARQVAATFDGTIDLLLTDVVMPEMNGRDLARLLCNDHRDMKVLFMSGYPGATIDLEADLKDGARFLAKPFTVISLANSVRALRGEVDESP